MAIIDLRLENKNGDGVRYESDIVPRVGETITMLKSKFEYRVLKVDHLIKLNRMRDCNQLELITVIVENI